jgi:hypothetical protein
MKCPDAARALAWLEASASGESQRVMVERALIELARARGWAG